MQPESTVTRTKSPQPHLYCQLAVLCTHNAVQHALDAQRKLELAGRHLLDGWVVREEVVADNKPVALAEHMPDLGKNSLGSCVRTKKYNLKGTL